MLSIKSFWLTTALALCLGITSTETVQAAEDVEICAKVRQSDGSWSDKVQLFGRYLTRDERFGIDGRRGFYSCIVYLHIYWTDVDKNTFIEMHRNNQRLSDWYFDDYTDEEGYQWRMREGWKDCSGW